MARRRVLLGSVAVVVVGLAIGVWMLWPRTAITEENAAKLQPGMTLAEVEAILGGPARIETTGPTRADVDMDEQRRFERFMLRQNSERRVVSWHSDSVAVYALCGPDGRVLEVFACRVHRAPEALLDTFRRNLRL